MAEVVEALNSQGIGRNDRVAIVLPEGPELAVAIIAIAAGATCAPLNPAYRASEFDFYLLDLNCKALLVQAGSVSPSVAVAKSRGIPIFELIPSHEEEAGLFTLNCGVATAPAQNAKAGFAQPGDVAVALHTSGTTARPKLAPLTHRNICASAYNIRNAVELTERDRCLNVMPLFHIHGLSTIFASLAAGASVICPPSFSAPQFFDSMGELHPTWYTAAPAIHHEILKNASRYPEIVSRSGLRFIRSASSAMPSQAIADMERVFRTTFIEAYGMTEAAPQVASNRLSPARRKPGSVGPSAGPEIAIFDESGDAMPEGQAGEVVIRGENVIEAYGNHTDANQNAFVRGWFRTGDLGYLDSDGYLFITGRLKETINRGGEKISPREVDEVLLDHPAIAQAATFAISHSTLGEAVAAAIVLQGNASVTEAEIRQFAAARLAQFKVPQTIAIVHEIPMGPTGKLERTRLAEKLGLTGRAGKPAESVAPRTPIEERLVEIWVSVLGIARPGIHDNFFQCGGDSLTATRVIARVRHEFQAELPIDSLFTAPTVAELAEFISQVSSRSRSWTTPAQTSRGDAAGSFPLSFAQERLWFLDQIEAGNAAYNVCASLWLTGNLSPTALEQSLNEIRRRHEVLRTTFHVVDEEPVQIVSPSRSTDLPVVDLTGLPQLDREREALRLAAEEAERPFDLAQGPLFRASLIRLSAEEHVLLLTLHHIISDGWSIGVLHRELGTLYEAFLTGQQASLPDLPIQYADFAAWQREWLQGEVLQGQIAYWKDHLRSVPLVIDLPTDRPRPTLQSFRGSMRKMVIPRPAVEKLKALSLRENGTLFMTLMAAFQTLLLRYTGQDDFIIGTPIANRTRLDTEALIGFFANTLALRANLSGDPSFSELLGRVRATAKGAYAHQDMPFEKLVDELQPERDPNRMPIVQVMFAFQNLPDDGANREKHGNASEHRVDALMTGPRFELAQGLAARPFKVDSGAAKFDLTLYLWEAGQEVGGTWQYNADLFNASTIERIAGHFLNLLEEIVANSERRLSEFSVLGDAERRQLEIEWNRPTAQVPQDRCFHHIFEAQAGRTPDAVALEFADERITYGELNGRANQLARYLQKLGVGPETLVGICLTRSAEMVVALLGVLKAGGAYVPLDPEYPVERLAYMLQDARLQVLVTEDRLVSLLKPKPEVSVVRLDTDREIVAREDLQNTESGATAANLAYVIYTSGSMGRPKGAMIAHGNVCHYVDAMRDAVGVVSEDRYLHTASFGFSSSVRQLAVPLSCGSAVVIARTDEIRDPRTLFDFIRTRRISIMDLVPSYWQTCIEEIRSLEPDDRITLLNNSVRLILSASERLSPDVPREWASSFQHGARMINMYGQTETTGIVTVYPIATHDSVVPIGRPIANTQVYVLDASRRPVPIGVSGELYIGGAGVGRGYLNQPDLAVERFVPDPFRATKARLYRTGDMARFRADGNIEFIGRADNQIKVRGFRIDPAEIEAALRQHPWVRESAVVQETLPSVELSQRLVAFVVTRSRVQPERLTTEVREFLKRKLPQYMVPSVVVELESLPLTANGKLDRRALANYVVAAGGRPMTNVSQPEPLTTPSTHAERILSTVWQEILSLESVNVEDNFFDLGGDSLRSVKMIRRANQAGLRLTVKQLFENQTIAELARVASFSNGATVESDISEESYPKPCSAENSVLRLSVKPTTTTNDGETTIRVSLESLRAYGCEVLERTGMPPEGAAIVTEVQLEASLRGQPTHNMDSIPRYARRITAGKMNPRPQIRIERETAVSVLIDGDNGPGQWVAVVAMETAIRKAKEKGLAVVGVRRSNHLGAAGHYVWLAAQQGLIGLCTTNGPIILAPTGGVTPTFGNNPLGVGIPAGRHRPILLDIAMSVAPRGKIGLQLAEGKPLPPGWILDRFGRPSTDPADLVAGLGVPIGGHKGYGLALVFEVLAGVLTGAGFCGDHTRELMHHGSSPRDLGHFFMAIDPELFGPSAEFKARVDRLIEETKAGERAENVDEILIPGELEMRERERNMREGVPVRPLTYRALRKYGDDVRLKSELVLV